MLKMKREINIPDPFWKPFEKNEVVKRLGRDEVLKVLLVFLEKKKGFAQQVIDYIIHDEDSDAHVKIRRNIIASKENYFDMK